MTQPIEDPFEERLRRELLELHAELFAGGRGTKAARISTSRRRAIGVAASLALVGSGAGLAASLGGRGGGDGRSRLDAALVVKRIEVAIKDGAAAGYVGYDRSTTYSGGSLVWSEEDWFSGSESRSETFAPDGTPMLESWQDGTNKGAPVVEVDYQARHYYEGPSPLTTPGGPYGVLNREIEIGELTVSGPSTVDGVEAYELSESPRDGGTYDIWVNASTFFVVRWVMSPSSGVRQTWDYSWSKPTPASLGELAQPAVPAGFTVVHKPWLAFGSLPESGSAPPPAPAATTTLPSATTTVPAATTTVPATTAGATSRP